MNSARICSLSARAWGPSRRLSRIRSTAPGWAVRCAQFEGDRLGAVLPGLVGRGERAVVDVAQQPFDERFEQGDLVREVRVDGVGRDPQPVGDAPDRRCIGAALVEQRLCRVEDLVLGQDATPAGPPAGGLCHAARPPRSPAGGTASSEIKRV